MTLDTLLVFFLPPLVGAAIGLFTNWLAIKMLFRPLKEYRILGMRVPFTPGILPRERHGIAISLGDTVARDLLTEDAISARLGSAEFRQALGGALEEAVGRILAGTPGDAVQGLDPALGTALRELAVSALRSVSASPAFTEATSAAFDALADELGPARIASLADAPALRTLAARLAEPDARAGMARAVSGAVFARLDAAAASGATVGSILKPDAFLEPLLGLVSSAYPEAGAALVKMLSGSSVRQSMEKSAARLLRKALDRFNAVQRFFIGLGQYDKAILENVPASVSDFLDSFEQTLAEPSTREAVLGAVRAAVTGFCDRPVAGFPALSDPERRAAARETLERLVASALDALDPSGLPELVRSMSGELTVRDALGFFPGAREALTLALVRWFCGLLSGGEPSATGMARVARAFAGGLKSGFDRLSLGEIVGADGGMAARLATAAAGSLASLAARESASMLRTLDLRSLVVAKIDSLDMIEIERMLLRVMDRELKAITWFGAVLGGAMGLVQSLLGLLR